MGKSTAKPRPGKTQSTTFSRVLGPTLETWIQSHDETKPSIEACLKLEVEQRKHESTLSAAKKPIDHAKNLIDDEDGIMSRADESSECSYSELGDNEDDDDRSETFAEREAADYGSSEDECYQIRQEPLHTTRPFNLRPKRTKNIIIRPPATAAAVLKEEEFVPE